MKTITVLIFGLILFASCSDNIDREPRLKDFQNDWDRDNLLDKVKTLSQFKANVTDFENNLTDKPIIEFKKEYSDFGKIIYQEYFDNFGKLEQFTKNSYNDKAQRIKSINENLLMRSKSTDISKYDSTGRLILAKASFNDTLHFSTSFEYDSMGNIIKSTSIQNNDTSYGINKYTYNEKGKVLSKIKFDTDGNKYLSNYKYNENNEIIESVDKSELFGEMKTTYRYDEQNRIKTITHFKNKKIEEERNFDKHLNPVSIKYYENSKLYRELKNEYSFDNYGNWIEKKVLMKQHFAKEKKFIPIYLVTRKIEYYE
ncbi:MAG: hypothetical protein GXO79_11055 [Chlorobi bacterium]|nr:hypothetical protein [Chlorobiota bacterium]